MSCFYKFNTYSKASESRTSTSIDNFLYTPKFYTAEFTLLSKSENLSKIGNVIEIGLGSIGLSLASYPCGILPNYDIYNMSTTQAIKLGLLEGIKDSKFYELCLDESGSPIILDVGEDEFNPEVVYYSVVHGFEKVDYCVIVKGLDPMPERVVKDPIPLIVNGEGNGVEIIGLGNFLYDSCENRIYDYQGCISYGDPHLEDTTKDEMDSVFELENFESLIGYAYTCRKPEDVDVVFSDTSQRVINLTGLSEVNLTTYYGEDSNDYLGCNPCARLEPEDMNTVYESDVAILSVDQVIVRMDRITNFKSTSQENYSDVCQTVDEDSTSSFSVSNDLCDYFDIDSGVRQLTIGQDFYYEIEDNSTDDLVYNVLKAGIPVMDVDVPIFNVWFSMTTGAGISVTYEKVIKFAGNASYVFWPFDSYALITVDKPAIFVTQRTSKAIGRINNTGAVFSEGHTLEIAEIAKQITLVATPIVTLDKPSNTAYYVDGVVTLVDMADCIQDNDPTTMEDLQDTPCEVMDQSTSGKTTIDVTLPFLEDDNSIANAAQLLGDKFSGNYTQSVSVVPGNSVSASDLGKNFQGGVINKIVWSYQDKSFYKATITTGPFLTGVDSFNTSMWVRHTDQNLSREALVTGDHGNGLEFKVYVRNIGTYTALNMTLNTIEVGDVVSVTIYNNPAETYYE